MAKRVMIIVGTRPEAIKLAPIILTMRNDSRYEPIVVSTGQHKEMLAQILNWFNITPDRQMDVMAHKQPLAQLSGKILNGMHTLVEACRPEVIMVQGDTTTAFMAALAGYYGYDYYVRTDKEVRRKIEIAHVEAGLRTNDNYSPFPEEVNRRLIGHIATYHFAPTETSAENLFNENITKNVFITGNTVIDALFETTDKLSINTEQAPLDSSIPLDKPYVLITGHRRESYGEGFEHICNALVKLAQHHPETNFIYPVHLNHHVHDPVQRKLTGYTNIILTEPQAYPQFVRLMQGSKLLLTDSGGLQEEGPSLGKPVLVMREVTERPEAIIAGTAKIVGTTEDSIFNHTHQLLTDEALYTRMANAVNPYGDGFATQRILNILAGEAAAENTFTPAIAA